MVGSATATLAARLATLPATSSAHGSTPPLRPARESASKVVDAATIMPSTDSGASAATHPVRPRIHDRPPTANSPVRSDWLLGALAPRTPRVVVHHPF